MSGPLNCGCCAFMLGAMLLGPAVPAVLAADPNRGYPTTIVPLPPRVLVCETAEEVEAAFESWRLAFERRVPEGPVEGCMRPLAGLFTRIEFLRPFDSDHWSADLLKYFVFRQAAPGTGLLLGVYYGFGNARMKPGVLAALPKSDRL